jgi:hypothetical protein
MRIQMNGLTAMISDDAIEVMVFTLIGWNDVKDIYMKLSNSEKLLH